MIRDFIALMYLSTAGFMDYRKRSIPLYLPIIGIGLGTFLFLFQRDYSIKEMLIAIIPGLTFVVVSFVTSGKIGLGDGLIMIPFGILMGFWDSTISMVYAMIFSGTVALFLLATKKRNGNYEMPFLPFLLCGLVLNLLTKTR